jgi:biopolymer transport protein ExbD
MLDMAFQLLAYFILTFKAPTAETHLDLDLSAAQGALAVASQGNARPSAEHMEIDIENDLLIRAEADELGALKALWLGEAGVPDLDNLETLLHRYGKLLEDRSLRVRLVADENLRYEPVAQIIATCSTAGVAAIWLTQPRIRYLLPSGSQWRRSTENIRPHSNR